MENNLQHINTDEILQPLNDEEIINNFFNFFINLEESDKNGEKFKIDWI